MKSKKMGKKIKYENENLTGWVVCIITIGVTCQG